MAEVPAPTSPEEAAVLRANGFSDDTIYEMNKHWIDLGVEEGHSEVNLRAAMGLGPGKQEDPSMGFLTRLVAGHIQAIQWGEKVKGTLLEGVEEGFGPEPVGLSGGDTEKFLKANGIIRDRATGRNGPLRMANDTVIRGTAALLNGAVRSIKGGVEGATEAAATGVKLVTDDLGIAKGLTTGRLTRDFIVGLDAVAVATTGVSLRAIGVNAPKYQTTRRSADGTIGPKRVAESLPYSGDFAFAADAMGAKGPARSATIANLRRAWEEKGVHPREALQDATDDVILAQDLATGARPRAYFGDEVAPVVAPAPAPVVKTDHLVFSGESAATGAKQEVTAKNLDDLNYGNGLQEVATASGVPTKIDGVTRPRLDVAADLKAKYPHLDKSKIPYDFKGFADTRGKGDMFHGTSSPIPGGKPSEGHYRSLNYYGNGFYTTDAADVAGGYSRARGAKDPTIYRVTENTPSRMYDMEAPLTPELQAKMLATGDIEGLIEEALSSNAKNMREVFDDIRDNSFGAGVPADEVQNIFDSIQDMLKGEGYTGMRHQGGLRTRAPEHDTRIYFNPETDVTLTKVDPTTLQAPLRLTDEVAPLVAPADSTVGAAAATTRPTPVPGTVAAAHENVMAKVVKGYDGRQKKTLSQTASGLYTDLFDYKNPLNVKVKEALGTGNYRALDTIDNPYELSRLLAGINNKADHFLEHSPFKFDTFEDVGRPLRAILKPFDGELDGLRSYALAKRSVELANRGIDGGIAAADARLLLSPVQVAKYDHALGELVEYQNHVLNYMRDAGVLSADAVTAMKTMNKDYIPFFRVIGEGHIGGLGGGIKVINPIKAIKGSELPYLDPLESIIKNTYTYLALAEKNNIWLKFDEMARNSGRAEDFMVRVPPAVRKVDVKTDEMSAFLAQNGITNPPATVLEVWRSVKQPLAKDEIAFFRDGKREVYRVDPTVAEVYQNLDATSANLLTRILAVPARTLRTGAVLNPEFISRGIIRDQLGAFIQSNNIPFYDLASGVASLVKRDESYRNFLKSSGGMSSIMSTDRLALQEHIFKLNEQTGLGSRVWNYAKSPMELLRVAAEVADTATRVGIFKRTVKGATDKASILRGGIESREGAIDFARVGAKMRGVSMINAFLTARMQGLDKVRRSVRDEPLGTLTKGAAAVTLPSLYLWWAQHRDPRWKEIPDWQRDLFWTVFTDSYTQEQWDGMDDAAKLKASQSNIYRIPMPHEYGLIFGALPVRMLEKWVDGDEDALRGITQTMLDVFAFPVVPTAAQPLAAQFANMNMFTKAPMVPPRLEGSLPEYRYNDYTSETAKAIGRIFGAFPGMKEAAEGRPAHDPIGGVARALTTPVLIELHHRVDWWSRSVRPRNSRHQSQGGRDTA